MAEIHVRDEDDLARFGYKQELKRTLGVFSSFAVAFSYISPSTGIFTLFYLALTIGGFMFWTWPAVAPGVHVLDVPSRRARAAVHRTRLRRTRQPLSRRRLRVPVVEVPLQSRVCLVHG